MTSAPPTKKLKVEGMTYHESSKALHLRVVDSDVLVEVAALLRHHHDIRRSSMTDAVPHCFLESQSLHLSIGESFFRPHPPTDNNNDNQQQMSREEQQLMALCSAVADCLPHVQEIHFGRALTGFIHSNVGAWCPVEAIQLLLASGSLESVMLRNLQVYSSQQRQLELQQIEEGPTNTNGAALLLANSLTGHRTLRRFGWQHSELVPRAQSSLNPMLQALSTIPNLNDVIVQCPPWMSTRTAASSTDPQVLATLVGPSLSGLHMDGLHLHDNHVRSLLLKPSSSTSLQSLSLSLHLTMGNIAELGHVLAEVLLTIPSLVHVGLRLDWRSTNADNSTAISRSCHKQRLQALQMFQDTIAQSFLADRKGRSLSQLERLDLIYYDSSQRWDTSRSIKQPHIVNPEAFEKVLERNFSLKHLRLPYCGEMDPSIDFLLKLNRTGLRRCLLAQDEQPTRQQCLEGLMQVQKDHGCWTKVSTQLALCMSKNTLSSIYYLLHEMPCLFC